MIAKNYIFGRKYGSQYLNKLIAYYLFENNGVDSINGHNGTNVGSIGYTTGVNGQSALFTAQNQYFEINDTNDFSFTTGTSDIPFSVSCWIYITSYSSAGNRFLSKADATTREYLFNISSTNIALVCYRGSVISRALSVAHGFSLNTWYHLVFTYDGTSIKIYKNGVDLGGTTTDTGGTYTNMSNTTIKPLIGKMTGVANSNHLGRLDELAIWKDRVITSAEALDLYNSGVGKYYPSF